MRLNSSVAGFLAAVSVLVVAGGAVQSTADGPPDTAVHEPLDVAVRTIADSTLVTNPVALAVGEAGTLWVIDRSSTGDSVLLLRDDNGDGVMDTRHEFVTNLINVRGMIALGPRTVVVLEPPALLRVTDSDGDGRADAADVLARGLADARSLTAVGARTSAPTLIVAGADGTFTVTAKGLDARKEGGFRAADLVTATLDDQPLALFGTLMTEGFACEPVGLIRTSALVDTRAGVLAVDEGRARLVRVPMVGSRWTKSVVAEPATVWEKIESAGLITALARASSTAVLVATDGVNGAGGRVVEVSFPSLKRNEREEFGPPPVDTTDEERQRLDATIAGASGAERRKLVERALAGQDAAIVTERLAAALRLNDMRPRRLQLDAAPSGFDPAALATLDPVLQRVMRRLQWPGRQDAAMDVDPPPSIVEVIDHGRRLYSTCLTCHGPAGRGQEGVYPPLAGSSFVTGEPATLIKIVLHGLEGPVSVGGKTFAGTMPPPPLANDDDVAAVLTYVRQAFGNAADPISAAEVARVRAAHASRRQPWTVKELESQP